MNYVFIATLVIFVIICLIGPVVGPTYGSDHPLCKPTKILGIFNFKEDLFFQIRIGDRIDFWKLNETEVERIEGKGDLIPKVHYNMSYLETEFKQTLIRETIFDIKKRVTGFVPNIEQIVADCTANGTQYPPCLEILEVNANDFTEFVCLYGSNKDGTEEQIIMPVKYDRYLGLLVGIKDLDLIVQMRAKCRVDKRAFMEEPNPTLMSAMVWLEVNTTVDIIFRRNISLFVNKASPAADLIILGYDSFINDSFQTYKRRHEMVYLFRYNRQYNILSCPQDCQLNTQLGRITYDYDIKPKGDIELDLKFELTNFTINDLLRCEYWERFEPQLFCEQKQNFDHIFNLGSDVYFQKSGHFWRYSSLGFTNEANKGFKQNITNIRFDSDLQSILEGKGFETNYPILGFSYKSIFNYHCDSEPDSPFEGYQSCQQKYNKSEHHYNVCIFGYKTGSLNKELEILPFHWTYVLTPSGVNEWTEADETNSNTNYLFCTTLLSALFVEIAFHNGSLELIAVASYDNIRFNKNEFHFLLRDRTSNKYKFIFYSFPREAQNLETLGSHTASEELDENHMPIHSLFYYDNQIYGYGKKGNGELFTLDDMTLKLSPLNDTIDSLFKCPFDQSYSAVTSFREDACPSGRPHDFSERIFEAEERESVFSIGHHVYFQKGQQFFMYYQKYNSVFYDKYVSDLFGIYFDTRERVTGFTVPKSKTDWNEHFIVIHGKSHVNFRELGEYIFAAFDVKADGLGTLIPVNDPKQLFNESVNSDQFISLGVKSDMFKNIGQSLIATHYWRGIINYVLYDFVILIQRSDDHKIYHKMETTDRKQSMFPFIKDFQSDKWKNHSVNIADLKFNRIVGLYSTKEMPLRLVAWSSAKPQTLDVYTLIPTIESHLKDAMRFATFDGLFCTLLWPLGSSSAIKAGYYILVILVFVLIVLALVIGFVSYRQNRITEDSNNDQMERLESKQSKPMEQQITKTIPKSETKSKSDIGAKGSSSAPNVKSNSSDGINSMRSSLVNSPKSKT